MQAEDLKQGLLNHDARSIAKLLSYAQSNLECENQLVQEITSQSLFVESPSTRIVVTGIPGIGKSSFIQELSLLLLKDEKKSVAILTVDPSSPISGGSLLADRTRMDNISGNPRVYIRNFATRDSLGGTCKGLRKAIQILEMAGYSNIIIETAGVGQTEVSASYLADYFVALQMPSTGDIFQAMKKGVFELADMIIVHKDDGVLHEASLKAEQELKQIHQGKFIARVSSLHKTGLEQVFREIFKQSRDSILERRRNHLKPILVDELVNKFTTHIRTHGLLSSAVNNILQGSSSLDKVSSSLWDQTRPKP